MPNRPTATETKLNPASRSGTPKVNRAVLVNPSRPTVLSRMPSTIMAMAFSVDPLARAIETTSPRTTTANSSAWPKFSAARASGIAATARTTVARVPATKEEMAATARAVPARPCRAIWYPSSAVTAEDDSPGRLMRIAVVDPPYCAP